MRKYIIAQYITLEHTDQTTGGKETGSGGAPQGSNEWGHIFYTAHDGTCAMKLKCYHGLKQIISENCWSRTLLIRLPEMAFLGQLYLLVYNAPPPINECFQQKLFLGEKMGRGDVSQT